MIGRFLHVCGAFLLLACNSSTTDESSYKTATGDGALRAHLDEVDQRVRQIERKKDQLQILLMDSINQKDLSTGYLYWDELKIYHDDGKLKLASLLGTEDQGHREKHFYFGEDQHLIYSFHKPEYNDQENEAAVHFYYILEKLVKVRNADGKTIAVNTDSIKFQAMEMMKESQAIRDLVEQKTRED